MTRLELGGLVLELTPEQVDEAREQLGVQAPAADPLDVKGMAARIGRSPDFVYDHAGELGGEKIGGCWVFGLDCPRPAQPPEPNRAHPRPRQRRRQGQAATLELRGSKPL